MTLSRLFCLTALCSFLLLSQSCGQEEATYSTLQPESPRHAHPIFEHWQAVLMEQSEPEKLLIISHEEAKQLTEEQQKEVNETREHIDVAMQAAQALFEARMAIIQHALNVPGSLYLPEAVAFSSGKEWEEEGQALYATCEQWVAEGFRRDLEALSFSDSWLDAGCVEPALRPGRQELLLRSEQESLSYRLVDGDTNGICSGYSELNTLWRERQDAYMKRFLACYGDGEGALARAQRREPFSGMYWLRGKDGNMTPETLQFRTRMQELIRHEIAAWNQYAEAMCEMVCPCSGYRGSGVGIFTSLYESHLLDSRERFLCLLAVGCEGVDSLQDLMPERSAALVELHPNYRFGEILTESAYLFRHPKLVGQPWCICFPTQGAGFILVSDGAALRRYAAAHPEGGEIKVRGYQSIEVVGTPYEFDREKCSYVIPGLAPRPDGAMAPQQVFHLLSCAEEEQDQEQEPGE